MFFLKKKNNSALVLREILEDKYEGHLKIPLINESSHYEYEEYENAII